MPVRGLGKHITLGGLSIPSCSSPLRYRYQARFQDIVPVCEVPVRALGESTLKRLLWVRGVCRPKGAYRYILNRCISPGSPLFYCRECLSDQKQQSIDTSLFGPHSVRTMLNQAKLVLLHYLSPRPYLKGGRREPKFRNRCPLKTLLVRSLPTISATKCPPPPFCSPFQGFEAKSRERSPPRVGRAAGGKSGQVAFSHAGGLDGEKVT